MTTTERGYGWKWQKLRLSILDRDKHLCQPCRRSGRHTPAKAVDHIKPKAKGGGDEPENLQSICDPCHEEKTLIENGRKVRIQIGQDGWPTQ